MVAERVTQGCQVSCSSSSSGHSSTIVEASSRHDDQQPESMQVVERRRPRRVGHEVIAQLASDDQRRQRRHQQQRCDAGKHRAPDRDDHDADCRGEQRVGGRDHQQRNDDERRRRDDGLTPRHPLDRPCRLGRFRNTHLGDGSASPDQHSTGEHSQRCQQHSDPHRALGVHVMVTVTGELEPGSHQPLLPPEICRGAPRSVPPIVACQPSL